MTRTTNEPLNEHFASIRKAVNAVDLAGFTLSFTLDDWRERVEKAATALGKSLGDAPEEILARSAQLTAATFAYCTAKDAAKSKAAGAERASAGPDSKPAAGGK